MHQSLKSAFLRPVEYNIRVVSLKVDFINDFISIFKQKSWVYS